MMDGFTKCQTLTQDAGLHPNYFQQPTLVSFNHEHHLSLTSIK